MKNDILERRLPDESTKLKITQFELVFEEKSWSKRRKENSIVKREKIIKFYKINLVYLLKLKYNGIR